MAIARNAPCPCGSGKKHKHCCLGKGDPKARRRGLFLAASILVGAVAAGIVVGLQTEFRNGMLVGMAGVVLTGIYLVLRNAPRSRGRLGADRIDFGR